MIVYASKPEEQYYEVIGGKGPLIAILGERGEALTAAATEFLEKVDIPVFFFQWSKVPEIRLQLGLIKYPVVQLWHDNEMASEVVGYQDEPLEDLVRAFLHLKNRGTHD